MYEILPDKDSLLINETLILKPNNTQSKHYKARKLRAISRIQKRKLKRKRS